MSEDKPAPDGDEALVDWVSPSTATQVDRVKLDQVHDGWTPARVDELPLAAAVAVVRSVGIVDPVLLRPVDDGFEVVAGHRVVAAARSAGLDAVPAVVKRLDDAQALMAMALDGTATGKLTVDAAAELRARMAAAGLESVDIDDVMSAVAVAAEVPLEAAAPPVAVEAAVPAAALVLPALITASAIEGRERAAERWVPLPAGRPRLARLSSAFADVPRMLRLLASDGFTGTVELNGPDGRRDSVTFLEGQCVATSVEEHGHRVALSLRLPSPENGPTVEITVRPHPTPVVVALALALRAPARLVGLHASFVHLPGLLDTLSRRGDDAACVVSTPRGAGVILISGGEPIAAYARREGEEPGEAAESTDVAAVADLLTGGEGEVDVHGGPLVAPLDLEQVIASASPSA